MYSKLQSVYKNNLHKDLEGYKKEVLPPVFVQRESGMGGDQEKSRFKSGPALIRVLVT
jgi:hypothetical protein